MGDGFWAVCTGMGISTVLGFIFVQIFGLSEEKNLKDKTVETKIEEEHAKTVFISPMSGDLVKLDSIDDPAFSSGSIGKGIAINPNNGKVVAPVDGTIKTIFPTKHAIGIESEDGIECLIHIGMDTVNLQGKYFNVIVKEGQQVKQGELIAEVDLASILKEGYSLITPVIVTNADQYLDVLPFETQGIIVSSEPLLTVLK